VAIGPNLEIFSVPQNVITIISGLSDPTATFTTDNLYAMYILAKIEQLLFA
jgi:hypothetical protein